MEFNNDVFIAFIAFIDLEKAFDIVPWKVLFKTLDEIEIDYRDRRLIYNIYKKTISYNKGFGQVSNSQNRKGSRIRVSTVIKIIQYL